MLYARAKHILLSLPLAILSIDFQMVVVSEAVNKSMMNGALRGIPQSYETKVQEESVSTGSADIEAKNTVPENNGKTGTAETTIPTSNSDGFRRFISTKNRFVGNSKDIKMDTTVSQ